MIDDAINDIGDIEICSSFASGFYIYTNVPQWRLLAGWLAG
jgi:hypothetical protein